MMYQKWQSKVFNFQIVHPDLFTMIYMFNRKGIFSIFISWSEKLILKT